jgi:dephospho-CoA kinase
VFRDGDVDRAEIGRIAFADRAELDWLEHELHPRVRSAVDAWLRELRTRQDAPAVAVVEVPLLFEAHGEGRFDRVVVVTAPAEVRAGRRDGLAERERRLIPDDEKVARADFAYVNDGTLEQLDAFVVSVLDHLDAWS